VLMGTTVVSIVGLLGVGRSHHSGQAPGEAKGTADLTATPRPGAALPTAAGPRDGAPQIVDVTGGAVPEVTERTWATAYLASMHWTVEAVERRQPQLLEPLYAPGQTDGATLQLIEDARAGSATLSYPPGHEPHPTRLLLVALSGDQQTAVRRDGGIIAGPYAWVVTWTGPTDLVVSWPGKEVQTYRVLRAGEQVTELSVGTVVEDPSLGPVWRETASRDCTAHPDAVLCPY
jgi:hypothetical protein